MSAINNDGANSVDQLISETLLIEVLRETDKDFENLTITQKQAILAVAAYKCHQDEIANCGTLSEAVYNFFGGRLYDDALMDYRDVVVTTLAALADPDFNKDAEEKLGGYYLSILTRMLVRLAAFMTTMETNALNPLLVIQDVKNGKFSEKMLLDIEAEYKERLRSSLSGNNSFA